MKLDNKTILVTGANRGIGKAIVGALLKQKVKKIYAAARNTKDLPDFGDSRVVAVQLDITRSEQIKKAVQTASDVDVLINNAGIATFGGFTNGESDAAQRDMQVNYFGTVSMVNNFASVIEKNGGGAIANVISVVGLASIPGVGGYSASKAALFSATQAMRSELKQKNISVHGIFPGPIDTDMSKDFPMDKTSPEVTVENIVAGLIAGKEDIFPDPMSSGVGELWAKDPKGLEKQFAAF
jgi:NAD(P)-dependent dehydrogenase (short-subunit alcohol dehydrogenase family)